MLAGAAAAIWALWNVAGDYKHWLDFARATGGGFHLGDLIPPTVPKVHGVSDHPNILGMTLVLIIPFYIVAAYRAPSLWERWGAAAALLAAAWAIFLMLSTLCLGRGAFSMSKGLMREMSWSDRTSIARGRPTPCSG